MVTDNHSNPSLASSEESIKKVLVIGAGPAGLACAYELSKRGIEVVVLESSDTVGGMAKSIDLWGQRVDLGPHRFFSKANRINNFFKELVVEDYVMIQRLTRIFYKRRFFKYPLQLSNVLTNLPLLVIFKILLDYSYRRIIPVKNPDSFEKWIINRFGKKLFETFFKSYSEKLWGIPCDKIDADWAAQRIKSLSLLEAVKSAIFQNKGNKHATLVDQFAYPKTGSGLLYENAKKRIEELNGKIHFGKRVTSIITNESNDVVGVACGDEEWTADHIVSTMPLTFLIKGLPDVPEGVKLASDQLYFRNTILVYLEIDSVDLFEDNWLYIHSPDVLTGRITNFRNWSPHLYEGSNHSIICLEYWCFDKDNIWSWNNEQLGELAKTEIGKIGLIPETANVLNYHIERVARCYPVYETGYKKHLDIVVDYMKTVKGVTPIGRYGSFKYNNQDHSILMGLLAAEQLGNQEIPDLWSINTDTEYQEEGKIKDVLLQ